MHTLNKVLVLDTIVTLEESQFMTSSYHSGDEYINITNGTARDKEFLFNQNYEVYYSEADNDIIITNHMLEGQDFYDFQDDNTFQAHEAKEALIKFIEYVNMPDYTPVNEIKTAFDNEYICLYRPFGLGAFPRVEVLDVVDCDRYKDGYHSIVKTAQALSDEDIKSFELKKLYR